MKENKTDETTLIALSGDNKEYEFSIKENYEYSYKKKKVKIEIIEEADGFTILSGMGVRYPVEVVSSRQNTYELLINGVSYSFSVETPFSLNRKKMLAKSASSSKKETIKAPMPGKILDVMVTEGQSVNIGEPLLILEAMKMQNTIASNLKGIITKVSITQGINVAKDDVLVEITRD